MSSLMLKLEHILLTYLVRFFIMTIDVLCDDEAGAHIIDFH
jgi:hypothetical protein